MISSDEKNIKILYLLTDSDFGGTEASVKRLVKGMRLRGYAVGVCSVKRAGNMARELSSQGIEIKSLNLPSRVGPEYPFLFLRGFIRLKRLLERERPDILHSFLFQSNLLAAMASISFKSEKKVKVFIHSLRCIERNKKRWRILFDRWTLKKADLIITVSEAVRKKYMEREGIRADRIRAVYHGVEKGLSEDQKQLSEDQKQLSLSYLRKRLGLCGNEKLIGTVGRLHPDKGIDMLLMATALSIRSQPAIKLLIIGDGPEKVRLKRLAKGLGLTGKVVFAGFQSDALHWMSLLDIFCLTSKEEGLPQSLLEAMALGKPVIATRAGGVEEVVRDRISGLLTPPDDPEAFCRAILDLVQNPGMALELGKAGMESVKNGFMLDHTLDQLEEIYHTCLKDPFFCFRDKR